MEIHSIWDTKQCLDVLFHHNHIVLIIYYGLNCYGQRLRSSFYNILWQFFTKCYSWTKPHKIWFTGNQKPYHLGSPYGSVFVFLIFSQNSQVFLSWEKLTQSKLRDFAKLQELPILPNLKNIEKLKPSLHCKCLQTNDRQTNV